MDFKIDKVIYGNDLDSLVFSFLTGIPIICEDLKYPSPFEHFKLEHHLELLNVSNEKNTFRVPDGVVCFNDSKLNVFKKILFFLSILGKIKFANDVKFVSLENPNRLKICTETNKIYNYDFEKLYIINDNVLKGREFETVQQEKTRVLEKFHVGKQLTFGIELFENESDFLKNVYITYSKTTSCTVESFLPHDSISELEYSLFYVKYGLMNLFRKYGNDFSEAKSLFTPIKKEIYENNKIKYNETDSIKQIRFSTEDYLCQEKNKNEIILESQDAYQLIVANKFLEMCTRIF